MCRFFRLCLVKNKYKSRKFSGKHQGILSQKVIVSQKTSECLFEFTDGIVEDNVENSVESVRNCAIVGFFFQQIHIVFNININNLLKLQAVNCQRGNIVLLALVNFGLSKYYSNLVFASFFKNRKNITLYSDPVADNGLNALRNVLGISNGNAVLSTSEHSLCLEAIPI